MTASERIENFFQVYLAAPIVAVFYIGFKLVYKTKILRARDMDISSGRRDMDLAEVIAEERAMKARWPMWKKVWKFFC